MISLIKKLFFVLAWANLKINYLLCLSLFLAFVIAIFEAFFVGLIFFFITNLLNADNPLTGTYVTAVFNFFEINNLADIKYYLALALIVNIILLAVIRLIHLKLSTYIYYKLNFNIGTYLYRNLLNADFNFHVKNNSSGLIAAIVIKSKSIGEISFFFLNISKSILILPFVIGFTAYLSSEKIFFIFFIFFLIFYLGYSLIKYKVSLLGRMFAEEQDKIFKNLQESFSSINLVIVHKIENFFYKIFSNSILKQKRSEARIIFLNQLPYIILQSIIFIIGIVFLLFQTHLESFISVIPLISMWFLASQRIMPNLSEIFSNYSTIKSTEPFLNDIYKLILDVNLFARKEINSTIEFNKFIQFKNVSYVYDGNKSAVLNQINVLIKKNTFSGIFGSTGSGKSTLINLISGVITPSSGIIFIDSNTLNKESSGSWQNNISLVPQRTILLDHSILSNIALEIDAGKIDLLKINIILKLVLLDEFIKMLPNGINTVVGENGKKISGGQRQKIGIARALYRDTNILILDEATNSLDEESERKILNNIKKLNSKTVVMISHNNNNKIYCEQVLKILDSNIIKEK